jgi:50S ribosomal protein L16 3-hydroxylase
MTFSIGMRAPSQAELIADLADDLASRLPEEARYADPDLSEPEDAFEIDEAAFGRVDRALAAMASMGAEARREWFGRFITRYRASGEVGPGPRIPGMAAVETALVGGGLLLRHPFSRSAWAGVGARKADRARPSMTPPWPSSIPPVARPLKNCLPRAISNSSAPRARRARAQVDHASHRC